MHCKAARNSIQTSTYKLCRERERVRAATFPIHFKSPLSEHNSIKTEILSQSIRREEEGIVRQVSRLTPDEGDLGKRIFFVCLLCWCEVTMWIWEIYSLHYIYSCFFDDLTKTQAQIYQVVSKIDIEMTSHEALALWHCDFSTIVDIRRELSIDRTDIYVQKVNNRVFHFHWKCVINYPNNPIVMRSLVRCSGVVHNQ